MTKSYDSICCFRNSEYSKNKRLLWEITTSCNLDCEFCHRSNNISNGIAFKEIVKILPFIKGLDIKEIIISGGEPLLREDIFEIIKVFKAENFKVDMCSNGTNITPEVASKLREVLSEISISIDSSVSLIHDSLRNRNGAWQKTVLGIKTLQRYGLEIHTISLVNLITLNDIENTVKFLNDLGLSSIAFIGNIPIGTGFNQLVSAETQALLRSKLKKLREEYPDITINTKELIENLMKTSCKAGEYIYGLDVDMVLKPCILQGRAGGIDLKRLENRTMDVVEKLKTIKERTLQISNGQGFCPGSRLLNSKI